MSLPALTASQIVAIAKGLKITNHHTGAMTPWEPNDEQVRALEASDHTDPIIYKPRAIGISTIFDLSDFLHAMVWNHTGHKARVGVCLDVDEKAKERIKQMRDFAHQLNIKVEGNEHLIRFPKSKTEIMTLSARGERPAAGIQFQRMRWSEFAFYENDAMAAMGPAVGLGAKQIIETTVSATGSNAEHARRIWRDPKNAHRRVFFSTQSHESYRHDPQAISDEDWVLMQAQGYSIRAAASWFLNIGVAKCGGSILKAYHEYPQKEEHLFQAGADRVISVTPPVAPTLFQTPTHGIDGTTYNLDVFIAPSDHDPDVIIGVDTSQARGQSNSAVVVTERATGRMIACFSDKHIFEDDLMRVALTAQRHYTPRTKNARVPKCIIEDNGIGQASLHQAARLGVIYVPFHQSAESKKDCITAAKRMIESGVVKGSQTLAEECDSLHQDEKGRYKGNKDIIMAYGMTVQDRTLYPVTNRVTDAERMKRVFLADRLREDAEEKMQSRPKWGV